MVDCLAFVKSLHPQSPKDLGTSTPIGWIIPMACQPLPLGFSNLLIKDPNSLLMNCVVAHQITFLQMEVPISKGAICLDCDGLLQVLILPFLFSKGLSRTHVLLL